MSRALAPSLLQVAQIMGIETGEGVADCCLNPCLFQEMTIRIGGDGVAVGHRHTLEVNF
jgi:hypothetical protein